MVYNTGESSQDLKEKYNPEGSVLRDAQNRMVAMLAFLKEFCEENKISWSLEGGNVLGAVRHEGHFVPWDDDVDVIMERGEYNRFIKCMETVNHPQFVLQTHKSDSGYYGTWVVLRDLKSEYIQNTTLHTIRKFKGLQIDIFPIQRGYIKPLSFFSSKLVCFQNKFLLGRNSYLVGAFYFFTNSILFPIFRMLSSLFGNKKYFSYEYGHHHHPRFVYDDVFPTKDLVFEGETVPGPCNVDNYLRTLYGDYMKLPPVERRVWHNAQYRIWD